MKQSPTPDALLLYCLPWLAVSVSLLADAAMGTKLAAAAARVRQRLASAEAVMQEVSRIVADQGSNTQIPQHVRTTHSCMQSSLRCYC